MGGRRVVRLRETGDALAQLFSRFLADSAGDGLVIVEAGDLPGRSALRRAFDEAPQGAAIGCYPDNARDLAAVIRETFAAHHIAASRDAVEFLVAHLGGDRLLTRSELEKLTLYAGNGGRIESAQLSAGGSIDHVLRSARPPIFFKQQDSYRRQLTRWNEARLRHALDRLAEAEFRMKQTGLPAETLCREAMFAVAQMARGSARSTAA